MSEPRPLQELAEPAQEPALQQGETPLELATPPTQGRAGYVELAFEQGLAPGRLSADGHMDFFDRGLLVPVVRGLTPVGILSFTDVLRAVSS